MTTRQINSICTRHGIPARYRRHFRHFILTGHILCRKFGRLVRHNFQFKTCLEEMLDVLSEPYQSFFEPTHFESLEQA